jgi:hypothetical protein
MQADGHESNECSAPLRFYSARLCTRSILATANTAALVQNIVVRNLAATKGVCYQYLAVPHSLRRTLLSISVIVLLSALLFPILLRART